MDSTKPKQNNAASSACFITVELRGGPHHGQHIRVPDDLAQLELIEAGKRHVYRRFNSRPVLYHADELAKFGGAA